MLEFYNIITFAFLSILSLYYLKSIIQGQINIGHIAYFVYYIAFAIPILLDLVLGIPVYSNRPGFKLATNDTHTIFIYDTYMIFIGILWFLFSTKKKLRYSDIEKSNRRQQKLFKGILWILVVFPILLVLFAPEAGFYLDYGAINQKQLVSQKIIDFHGIIHLFSLISIVSGILILLIDKMKFNRFLMLVMPWVFIAIWLNGKRSAVVIFIALLIISLVIKGYIQGWKLVIFTFICLILFLGYNTFYTNQIKYETLDVKLTQAEKYQNFRINYGRDDVTKLSIYSMLNDKPEILDYPGQSILFYLTFYVPRELWNNKPWTYPVYLTSAVFMNRVDSGYIGWTMTTSWFEEAISNFGIFGFLIGPALLLFLCRLGDRYQNRIIHTATLLIVILFIMLPLSSFIPLFLIWMIILIYFQKFNNVIKVSN
ncbi:hypothetical protein CFK37_08975 [Virgibacillus phasianinus]|uniref:Oligosaccharide repeat unit polymerase n=1 Tax=Virgibacillus phasianinus TaxID=2017483 RepID=A0A220U3H2_9BACI|nr:O-antigen polymerase [Virgibacillus phasianinus]ASK62283.1 hypothetical protein CFK37_08975 [Virgibacillus phasianinus]